MAQADDNSRVTSNQLRIGACRVFPARNQIESDGQLLHVEPKAMSVSLRLADHPGEPVPREVLLETAWSGTVVSDDVLIQAIIKLRKALGDSSRSPETIETIPKRGYRLLAPLKVSVDASPWQAGSPDHGLSGQSPPAY